MSGPASVRAPQMHTCPRSREQRSFGILRFCSRVLTAIRNEIKSHRIRSLNRWQLFELRHVLAAFSLEHQCPLKEQWQTTIIQAWILGGYFLKNEWSKPGTSEKTTESILIHLYHLSFQVEIRTLEHRICHHRLSFPILKDLPNDRGGDRECDLGILYT